MGYYLITFRSITFAQRGESALRSLGMDCVLLRAPKELSGKGCSYGLRLRNRYALAAVELLREREIPFAKVYALTPSGKPEERQL